VRTGRGARRVRLAREPRRLETRLARSRRELRPRVAFELRDDDRDERLVVSRFELFDEDLDFVDFAFAFEV